MVKAALNGNRSRQEHAAVPLTPGDLACEASLAVAAGAGALHVHPRDDEGRESVVPSDVTAAVSAIRTACPGVPVGVSTGAWIEPNVDQRLRFISDWSEIDFASVNFDEPGAEDVARLLLRRGIEVEAGLASPAAAAQFVAFGRARDCLRVLIEPSNPAPEDAETTVRGVETTLDKHGIGLPRLLHGADDTAWPMIELAGARGYDTRVGFEDTFVLPDGSLASSNAKLVATAVRCVASFL